MSHYTLLNFENDKSEMGENNAYYFLERLKLMTKYIDNINKQFKGKYWIRSTGSDPHQDAQHALFLISKITNKIISVYKPHDMSADAAVVGQNGMFAQINKLLIKGHTLDDTPIKGKNAFATMRIDAKKHTEEFITKKNVMQYQEALIYYFQFGMLKSITDAMAVIDLHADNIMPTERGPMIIDAEIDFFHYGDHSCLVSGPANAENGMEQHNSAFKIKVIKDTGNKYNKTTLLDSFWVFNGTSNAYLAKCFQKYKDGYNFMICQMKNKKDIFKVMFGEQLKKVNKVRILPIATSVFARNLQKVINDSKKLESVARMLREKIVNGLIGESINFLNQNAKIFPDVNDDRISVNINEDSLDKGLLDALKNGTIPAMYADMEGNIYFYDKIVGYISCNADSKIKISREKMIETIITCFLKIVEDFQLLE